MKKNRLEAFSYGVLAIIITIMVLEIKVSHGSEWNNLELLLPKFISYLFSFMRLLHDKYQQNIDVNICLSAIHCLHLAYENRKKSKYGRCNLRFESKNCVAHHEYRK